MKRLIRSSQEPVFAMSKLVSRRADKELTGEFGDFIYFSPMLDSHGPRIKFYGGSVETSSTRNAPSLKFDTSGSCTVILATWMNRKNCPNAYDDDYIQMLTEFVQRVLPILLLVWFDKLDESDALAYLEGRESFLDLLVHVSESNSSVEAGFHLALNECMSCLQLHQICKKYNMYRF